MELVYTLKRELEINNEILNQLKDIEVIFDVGARDDFNYFSVKPNAEYHLFEPNPSYIPLLMERIGKRKKVWVNEFGLGDEEGIYRYHTGLQAFSGGKQGTFNGNLHLPITTLDRYVAKFDVKRIDFFKTDTEGYDYKVLVGGKEILPKIKYIYFEHYNDMPQFHALLEPLGFELVEVGWRNVLSINKNFIDESERERIKMWLLEKGYKKDM